MLWSIGTFYEAMSMPIGPSRNWLLHRDINRLPLATMDFKRLYTLEHCNYHMSLLCLTQNPCVTTQEIYL